MAGLYVVLVRLALLFLPIREAVPLAAMCLFGTSLASTGMTALWSHDYAVLLAALALLQVFRATLNGARLQPFALALCLFLAYLCRPTMAVMAPFVLAYVWLHLPRTALAGGAWLAAMLACFSLWSRHEFGQLLPDYYLPARLGGGAFWSALPQNIVGPARGLFVFSPFLAVPIALAAILWRNNREYACALLIGLAWPLAHLMLISRFPHWWAGWSYGPRLMMDCLPGLFVLLFVSLRDLRTPRRNVLVLIGVLGAFSIYVNTWNGLFNEYAFKWNADPVVDQYPEYVSDWRYPQFLHNEKRHRDRLDEFNRMLVMANDNPAALFSGWSEPTAGTRWASSDNPSIAFPLADIRLLEPKIAIDTWLEQERRMVIRLNSATLHDGTVASGRFRTAFTLAPGVMIEGDNVLSFELGVAQPDADATADGKTLAFKSLAIFQKE